jgi:hypothetical protein
MRFWRPRAARALSAEISVRLDALTARAPSTCLSVAPATPAAGGEPDRVAMRAGSARRLSPSGTSTPQTGTASGSGFKSRLPMRGTRVDVRVIAQTTPPARLLALGI